MRYSSWLSGLFALSLCVTSGWATSGWAVDLTPYAKPDAILTKEGVAQRLVFWQAQLSEAYRLHGDHRRASDAELATVLSFTAKKMMCVVSADPAMTATAQRLAEEGDTSDPLASFAWFELSKDHGHEMTRAACISALLAFERDDATHTPKRYAHLFRAFVYAHALGTMRPKRHPEQLERANALAVLLRDALVASILAHEFDAAPSSFLRFIRRIDIDDSAQAEDVINALTVAFASAKTDEWLAHASLSALGITAAWTWRGSGWGSSVTPEGWAGFKRHLSAAEDHLTEAYRLNPTEPLLGVMGITLAGAGYSKVSIIDWLTRSMAACFDTGEIWDEYRSFATPRWGGSYHDMLDLGCDAVATKRFDTTVPHQLIYTIAEVIDDAHSMKQDATATASLSRPHVRKAVADCIAGYSAADPSTAAEYQCLEVGYLWHCGDKLKARAALLAIDPSKRHAGSATRLAFSYDDILAESESTEEATF